MTSRERVKAALNFQETDRPPFDLGATFVTGISAFNMNNIRKGFNLKEQLPKVFEPLMFLGWVEDDLLEASGSDFIGIFGPDSLVAYENKDWRKFSCKGQDFLVGKGFTYSTLEDGEMLLYPCENKYAMPSAHMPTTSYYFDHLVRQRKLPEDHPYNARDDYSDQYAVYGDHELRHFEKCAKEAYENTDKAIVFNCGMGGLGDFFHVPGPWLEDPRGVRNYEDWMMLPYLEPNYLKDFYEMMTEICIKDLELAYQAMGDRVDICYVSGTDFGTQNGPIMSIDAYVEFYKPYMTRIMSWIHDHTPWKTMNHTCGSVKEFIPHFIDTGLDILNPVQISATDMDPQTLKDEFGDKLVFCGGTADPQNTMERGTPEDVYNETRKNIEIFSKSGGFISAHIHNIQATTPIENLMAFFEAVRVTK